MNKKINSGTNTVRLSAYISSDLNSKLDEYSKRWGVSKSNLVSVGLGQYFDNLERGYDLAVQMMQQMGLDLTDGFKKKDGVMPFEFMKDDLEDKD